jgi:hypothetical protein
MSIPDPAEVMTKALADIEALALQNMSGTDVPHLQAVLNQIHAIARYKMPVPIPNELK